MSEWLENKGGAINKHLNVFFPHKIPFVVVNGSYEEKRAQDGDLGNALINERLVYSTYTEMIY